MSDTPISSAIRMASTTSALTRTYHCHPHASTLIVTRKRNRMFFLHKNELHHWLIQDLTTQTTWECGIDWQSWDHDQNICWTFWSGLLRNTWLGISLKVRHVIQRFISVLQLGLGSIDLGGMTSVFLQTERSEPTTWEVTSTQVQKHNLSTMLSK